MNEIDSARLGQVEIIAWDGVISGGLLPAGSFNLRMMVQWVSYHAYLFFFFLWFLFFFSFFPFLPGVGIREILTLVESVSPPCNTHLL